MIEEVGIKMKLYCLLGFFFCYFLLFVKKNVFFSEK